MGTKVIVGGLVVVGCIGAAAAGGYFALRSNAVDLRPADASTQPAATPEAAAAQAPSESMPGVPSLQPASSDKTAQSAPALPRAVSQTNQAATTNKGVNSAARATDTPSADTEPATAPASINAATTGNASNTDPQPAMASQAQAAPTQTATQQTAAPAPKPRYDEVTIASDSVIGVQLESTISTETAHVEDRVNARLSRDLMVDGRVAIAAGTRLEGIVTQVERGGKFKDRPRLGIAFQSMVMADSTRVAIHTETIYRDGESPSSQVKAKVGGSAVVGAILGAMLGGKKGAAIGGTAGAAGGAAAVAAGSRPETVLTSGTQLTARLTAPVTVLIERNHDQ